MWKTRIQSAVCPPRPSDTAGLLKRAGFVNSRGLTCTFTNRVRVFASRAHDGRIRSLEYGIGPLRPAKVSMSDDLQTHGSAHRMKVNVDEDGEVRWWCKEFGCTESELKAAVDAVGALPNKVLVYMATLTLVG